MSQRLPTVFLRLEGPLQAWGTTSHYGVRATGDVPSKSGVIGLVCSAMGLRRSQVGPWLEKLKRLKMGVRVDRPGRVLMDYHTSGAKIGLMSAQGKIKITQTTGEIEAQVSRCYYLADASFLAALQGEGEIIREVSSGLLNPVWPPFLGRKSCPPSMPVYAGKGEFPGVREALASQKWQPRTSDEIDRSEWIGGQVIQLHALVDADPSDGSSSRVPDVPLTLSPPNYGFRFVVETRIPADIGPALQPDLGGWRPHTEPRSARWQDKRRERLEMDRHLCVFCKEPAQHVHHVTYENAPCEETEDLRSVCELCHAALTMIEYSEGRTKERLDPFAVKWRTRIINARQKILNDSIPLRVRRRGD
jgi:CRISPR system Cascade subunit CasD